MPTQGIKLSKTILVEGRRGIKYLSQKLFFFERVRDFFDEIFNQGVTRVKNLIKHLIKDCGCNFKWLYLQREKPDSIQYSLNHIIIWIVFFLTTFSIVSKVKMRTSTAWYVIYNSNKIVQNCYIQDKILFKTHNNIFVKIKIIKLHHYSLHGRHR